MITAEMEVEEVEVDEIETDEEGVPYSDSVYPPELVAEWDRESALIEQAFKNGKKPKSLKEQFAEHGQGYGGMYRRRCFG